MDLCTLYELSEVNNRVPQINSVNNHPGEEGILVEMSIRNFTECITISQSHTSGRTMKMFFREKLPHHEQKKSISPLMV